MSTDHESDSVSEIAVSGGHAPQPAANKIKSCAYSATTSSALLLAALFKTTKTSSAGQKAIPLDQAARFTIIFKTLYLDFLSCLLYMSG